LLIIGILEQWKTGIMPARRPVGGGSEKLLQWFVRKILLKRKLKHKKLPYKIIIPQFHHSSIPCIRHYKKSNTLFISII